MPLGIRPTVDFVFKLLFGNPKNVDLLIHLRDSQPVQREEVQKGQALDR